MTSDARLKAMEQFDEIQDELRAVQNDRFKFKKAMRELAALQ
jgi:hypothetical protein